MLTRSVGTADEHATWMRQPGQIAGNHCHNQLRQPGLEVIRLHDDNGTPFSTTQVGVGKQDQHNITTLIAQRLALEVVMADGRVIRTGSRARKSAAWAGSIPRLARSTGPVDGGRKVIRTRVSS